MVNRKNWSTLATNIKRSVRECLTCEDDPTSISHGYMIATSNRTDLFIPRVLHGSTLYALSSAAAQLSEPKIYESLNEAVGAGGQASVGLWRCRSSGKLVAVKQFRGGLFGEAKAKYDNRVRLEFSIGTSIAHGNVNQVLELHKVHGLWLQVMEFAPYDLYATVAGGAMSWEEISCVFRQITAGIAHVHAQGFAHRDVKLDNILLDQHGIVKIIDFGCAIACAGLIHRPSVDGNGVVGTHPYVAPELFSASTVLYDAKALDVWSIAIILCTMFLGRFPWAIARQENHVFREFRNQSLAKRALKLSRKEVERKKEPKGYPCNVVCEDADNTIASREMNDNARDHSQAVVQQPELLRRLPTECKSLIAEMLEINPDVRLTSQMILEDAWVQQIRYCHECPIDISEHHKHTSAEGERWKR